MSDNAEGVIDNPEHKIDLNILKDEDQDEEYVSQDMGSASLQSFKEEGVIAQVGQYITCEPEHCQEQFPSKMEINEKLSEEKCMGEDSNGIIEEEVQVDMIKDPPTLIDASLIERNMITQISSEESELSLGNKKDILEHDDKKFSIGVIKEDQDVMIIDCDPLLFNQDINEQNIITQNTTGDSKLSPEIEGECSKNISEHSEKKLSVDINAIESIKVEDQDDEVKHLGLSVYDQDEYVHAVLAHVGKALTGDSEYFIKNENSQSEKEEGQIDDLSADESHKGDHNNTSLPETSTKRSNDVISSIDDYMKKQLQLQELRKSQGKTKNAKVSSIFKKKKQNVETVKCLDKNFNKAEKPKEKKSVYLGPSVRKKRKKEKLGTRKGFYRKGTETGSQPGEENYFYENATDSEVLYSESDSEINSFNNESSIKIIKKKESLKSRERKKKKNQEQESIKPKDASGSEYFPTDSDSSYEHNSKRKKQTKATSSKKKKEKEYLFFTERLDTDDSDWDGSDDVPKRRGNKELDDGDTDVFLRRIKEYERSTATVGVETVDGDFVMPKNIWENLYEYQKKAVKWFWNLNQKLSGGILGDEMGLGKTIQVIAFLAGLHRSCLSDQYTRYEGLGPTLIVCPTTVMHQWVREFHKWYPPLRVAILHESGTYQGKDRSKLVDILYRRGSHGIVITSYTGLVQYKDTILPKEWHYVVLDEGHKIRNHRAKVSETAKMLETPHRLILSGSPLQNNLQELWCLFDFVCPGRLGTLHTFTETFAVPIMQGGYANASQTQVITAHKCATILKDTITPYLLRRMKEDVGSHINLPEKKEQVLFCRLTDEQRELYKEYIETVDVQEMIRGKAKIFVALINLRKICNHPDLHSGGPNRNFKISNSDEPPNEEQFGYWKRAGKMIVVEALLKIWNQQGHRVLLFTQSKKMLLVMEDFVKRKKYKYLKLDGQTSVGARQPLIDKFNQDTSYFVMILTTKVGGLGVNLTGANRVVIYDPDWNPATDTQARERAWRIGQERDVTIYRLITAGTIEEKIYHRQIFKQFLSNKILKDPKQRRFFKSNDLLELFTLSETVKNGTTETAAIFAGTGSEIKRPKKGDFKTKANPLMEKVVFSESKIEQMKKLAQSLSKKISDSTKLKEENAKTSGCGTSNISKSATMAKENDSIYGPDGSINIEAVREVISSSEIKVSSEPVAGVSSASVQSDSNVLDYSKQPYKKEDHKSRKKKRKREKFAKMEGLEVPHLVKKRKYKREEEEDREKYMSQDDYVLKKLFSKGIETAMRHDTIMEGGPSDYAIVEAEAERVAQSALKALKESQQKAQPFTSTMKRRKRGEADDLMEHIRKRNLQVEASSSEQTLLNNMISWLQSQGGTTSTDLMVREFKYKVGAGKTPLFKALLEKIATFYRGPDKVGYWTIRDEYNSPSTSSGLSHR